jgi:hypothetical protein
MKSMLVAAVCAAFVGLLTWQERAPAEPLSARDQFTTEAEARATCPGEAVVWINPKSNIYHADSSRNYGKTKQGAYMCEKESLAAGFRAAKSARRASI